MTEYNTKYSSFYQTFILILGSQDKFNLKFYILFRISFNLTVKHMKNDKIHRYKATKKHTNMKNNYGESSNL